MDRPLRFTVLTARSGPASWQIDAIQTASSADCAENVRTFHVGDESSGQTSVSLEGNQNAGLEDVHGVGPPSLINDGLINLTEDSWERVLEGQPDFILNVTGKPLNLPRNVNLPLGEWFFSSAYGPEVGLDRLGELDLLDGSATTSLYLVERHADRRVMVLWEGHFQTNPRPAKTWAVATKSARQWVRQSCQEIVSNQDPFERRIDRSVDWKRIPVERDTRLHLLWKQVQIRIRDQVRYRFFRQQWNIGIVKSPIAEVSGCAGGSAQDAALLAVDWFPEQPGSFLADPFGYLDERSQVHILVEAYHWRRKIGEICHLTYDGADFGRPRLVLNSPCHLSYPFVFHDNGKIVFTPEHSEARDFSAFVIGHDAKVLSKQTIIGGLLPIIDGTLLFYGGTYWLFALDETVTSNTDLNIYFADSLPGPWRAHPMNPVKSDICSARPAGTPFVYKEQLYRPGQDCSTHYGRAITVNKVDHLTRTSYRESRAAAVLPADARYSYGLHTISQVGDFTLVDGARLAPVFPWLSETMAKLSGLKITA